MSLWKNLRDRIKGLEAQGHTGRTNPALDRLNRQQTNALSDQGLKDLIQTRSSQGKPIGKLAAAARERGIDF